MRRASWALAAAVGVGLALAVAGPDLPRLGGALPGTFNPDSAGAVSLHHAFHAAIAAGRSPNVDPNQLFPVGTPLAALHGGNALEMVLSGIFALILPWPGWYSAAAFAWIPLNLLAFLPLGRHLWGRLDAAVAAGAAWAIFPPTLGELAAGRLTQVVGLGLPLAVLGLLRLAERPRPGDRWLAGGGLALTAIGYWYYGIFLAILSPLFLVHGLGRRPTRLLLADFAAAGGLALLICLPFAWPVLGPRLTGAWAPAPPLDLATASPVFDNALRLVGAQPTQLRAWLPWAWVVGAALTLAWGKRQGLWLGCGLLAVIFALGPATRLGEAVLPLPYALLWRTVPFLDRLTHPGRWLGVGGLFLAITASDGLARRAPRALWLLPLAGLMQLYAAGNLALGTWRLELPPVWQALANRPGGAVIAVPVLKSPLTCRWQALVHRPLLGGMVEDKPWAWPPAFRAFVERSPLLMGLWGLPSGQDAPIPLYTEDLAALHRAGFDTVVLDQESWARLPAAGSVDVVDRLTGALGEPVFAGESGAIWELPVSGLSGRPPASVLTLPEP